MMERRRSGLNSVLNEIENSRVTSLNLQDDFDLPRNTAGTRKIRSKTVVEAKRFGRKHAAKSFINRHPDDSGGGGQYFDTKSRKSSSALNFGAAMTLMSENLNHGWLYKTSRGKITSDLTRSQHENRQYRRFQLTEHSLEYSQLLQRVCYSCCVWL